MIKNLSKAWGADVLLLLLGLEILAAGYVFDIKELKQRLGVVNSDLVLAKANEINLSLVSDKPNKKETGDFFIESKINLMGVLERLEYLANKAQVKHFLFEPLLTKADSGFNGVRIQMEVGGGQGQLDLFLKEVLSSYILEIDSFSLERNKQGDDNLMMRLIVIFYKIESEAKKEQFYKIVEESLFEVNRDVFNEHHSMGDLHWWDADDLCLIGTIERRSILEGVIGDPHGGVYQIKVGDKIGKDKTEVVGIAKNGVRLSTNKKILCIKRCN